MLNENKKLKGTYTAYKIPNMNPDLYNLHRYEKAFQKDNIITNSGRLRSYNEGLNFLYIAGGSGITTPTASDTRLLNELGRWVVTDRLTTVGSIKAFAKIPNFTGNQSYGEWGIFMDDASELVNTGTLYSRLLQNYTKTLGEILLIEYTITETLV